VSLSVFDRKRMSHVQDSFEAKSWCTDPFVSRSWGVMLMHAAHVMCSCVNIDQQLVQYAVVFLICSMCTDD
jgi:hypothetical protein